jgi:hypothetical protein
MNAEGARLSHARLDSDFTAVPVVPPVVADVLAGVVPPVVPALVQHSAGSFVTRSIVAVA